jgi:tellurite resistance protein TehA-like permease
MEEWDKCISRECSVFVFYIVAGLFCMYFTCYPGDINQSERMFAESSTFPQLPAHNAIINSLLSIQNSNLIMLVMLYTNKED